MVPDGAVCTLVLVDASAAFVVGAVYGVSATAFRQGDVVTIRKPDLKLTALAVNQHSWSFRCVHIPQPSSDLSINGHSVQLSHLVQAELSTSNY